MSLIDRAVALLKRTKTPAQREEDLQKEMLQPSGIILAERRRTANTNLSMTRSANTSIREASSRRSPRAFDEADASGIVEGSIAFADGYTYYTAPSSSSSSSSCSDSSSSSSSSSDSSSSSSSSGSSGGCD